MSKYQINGKLKLINEPQSFPSGFVKREFVVTTEDQYPQDIKLELFKEKISLIDGYSANDPVSVDFDIRGNEYNGKYYVSLVAWKVSKADGAASADAPESPEVNDFDSSEDVPF